jgi:hypothetical protein
VEPKGAAGILIAPHRAAKVQGKKMIKAELRIRLPRERATFRP